MTTAELFRLLWGGPPVGAAHPYSMGPFLLLIGLIGAFTLLTVQADGFRRAHGR